MEEKRTGPQKPPQLTTVEQNVMNILEHFPKARDNYQYLVLMYVREIDGIEMFIPFKELDRITPFESITRACRNIQNNYRMYLPHVDVKARRNNRQEETGRYYANR